VPSNYNDIRELARMVHGNADHRSIRGFISAAERLEDDLSEARGSLTIVDRTDRGMPRADLMIPANDGPVEFRFSEEKRRGEVLERVGRVVVPTAANLVMSDWDKGWSGRSGGSYEIPIVAVWVSQPPSVRTFREVFTTLRETAVDYNSVRVYGRLANNDNHSKIIFPFLNSLDLAEELEVVAGRDLQTG
jgi:hypothetical protein